MPQKVLLRFQLNGGAGPLEALWTSASVLQTKNVTVLRGADEELVLRRTPAPRARQ